MKCQACGYEECVSGRFYRVFVTIPQSDYDTEIKVEGDEESIGTIIYACPKCGTLKIDIEEE